MVKLTPELINLSMQFINPCRERELDLRGYKIPQIENLGATLDQFDTIDLSDNDLRKLDNLPYLPRLECLLLNNNRILRIGDALEEAVPNIKSIILTGNNLQDFHELEPLAHLPKLETLCLLMNPVSTKPHYREYMAWRFSHLRLLDFRKIKQKDRKAAHEFFKSKQGKEMLREVGSKVKASGPEVDVKTGPTSRIAKPEDIQRIREAIKKASSLQEIERLSNILQSGELPENFNLEAETNGVPAVIENGNSNGHTEAEGMGSMDDVGMAANPIASAEPMEQ